MAFGKGSRSSETSSGRRPVAGAMGTSKGRTGGFSRLTMAWFGLGICLVGLALAVVTLGDPEDAKPAIVLDIDRTPDRFAVERPTDFRPLEAEMYKADRERTLPRFEEAEVQQPQAELVKELPVVRAATAEERADMTAEVEHQGKSGTSLDAVPLVPMDENAEVISVLDLPKPGEELEAGPVPSIGRAPAKPDAALFQVTKDGPYPRVAQDGRTPSKYYARTFEDPENRNAVAVMVGGLGLNPEITRQAIENLPPEITLAFAPYARDLDTWVRQAQAKGHEVIIELPMEATGYGADKLGPASLLTTRSVAENQQRLSWILSRFSGYFGVTNYLGDMVTTNPLVALPILTEMQRAGIAYIDDTGISQDILARSGISYARVDFSMATAGSKETMVQQLGRLEDLAAARGRAIGKTYASQETLAALQSWAVQLDKETFVLAPVSAMVVGP